MYSDVVVVHKCIVSKSACIDNINNYDHEAHYTQKKVSIATLARKNRG